MELTATAAFKHFLDIQAAFQVLTTLNLNGYLFPKQAIVHDGQFFDYIVVGGGTAGCVVATRLAQMDRRKQVLLIEAGGDPPLETNFPGLILYPLKSRSDWNYTTAYDGYTQLCNINQNTNIVQGKMLGGTSSLAFLLYSIGNRHDYDRWAAVVKDKSWNWDGVFPYFKKSQRMRDRIINNSPDRNAFGTKGPISITKDKIPATRHFLKAFEELGYRIEIDINGNRTMGYAPELFYIGDGVRQSSATSYLAKKRYQNLKVLKNSLVTEVIIDSDLTATGVRVLLEDKQFTTINARNEIIISAGAIGTPKLLMQSGIGPAKHLCDIGIPVKVDSQVGQNLIDHMAIVIIYDLLNMTYNPLPRSPHVYPDPTFTGYATLDRHKEVPDYETLNFIDPPSYLMYYCVVAYDYIYEICDNLFKKDDRNQMLWSLLVNLNPKSRGYITIKTKDYKDSPIINPRYLSHSDDLENHVNQIMDFIKVENTAYLKSIGAKFRDPKLKTCQHLRFGSQEYWRCYVLCMMTTQWHFSGTCAMGSVVDSRLRVRGIRRLRIADASVIPIPISGDIEAAVIMVGEKMAAIIKEDNGRP